MQQIALITTIVVLVLSIWEPRRTGGLSETKVKVDNLSSHGLTEVKEQVESLSSLRESLR